MSCSKVYGSGATGGSGGSSNLPLEIARGNIGGSQPFGAFGRITTSSEVTNHLVWANGIWEAPPATGIQLSVVSDDDEDGVGGTGIRSLHVHYLDTDLKPHTEIVTLDGTTPVLTQAEDIRFLQCAHLNTYGSSKAAVGIIVFTNIAETQTYNQIDALENRCSSSARMVPAGKRAIIYGMVGSSVSGTAAVSTTLSVASSFFYDIDYTADSILIQFGSVGLQDGSEAFNLPIPGVFPEGSIVAMICSTNKNSVATITGDWFGWLEDVTWSH